MRASADYLSQSKYPLGSRRAPRTFGSPGSSLEGAADITSERAASGTRGERMTAEVLDAFVARHPQAVVYHSVRIPDRYGNPSKWDIDHVLMFPNRSGRPTVIVIDSKRWAAHGGEAEYALSYNPEKRNYIARDRGRTFPGGTIHTANEAKSMFEYLQRASRLHKGLGTLRCVLVVANDVEARIAGDKHFSYDYPLEVFNLAGFEAHLRRLTVGQARDPFKQGMPLLAIHEALAPCVGALDVSGKRGKRPTPPPAVSRPNARTRRQDRAEKIGIGLLVAALLIATLSWLVAPLPMFVLSGILTLISYVLVSATRRVQTGAAWAALVISGLNSAGLLGLVVLTELLRSLS